VSVDLCRSIVTFLRAVCPETRERKGHQRPLHCLIKARRVSILSKGVLENRSVRSPRQRLGSALATEMVCIAVQFPGAISKFQLDQPISVAVSTVNFVIIIHSTDSAQEMKMIRPHSSAADPTSSSRNPILFDDEGQT
jgi:hypothetical protein